MVAYGATHAACVVYAPGLLLVNPGSPNLASDRPQGELGTVAVLEFDAEVVTARIVELARLT